MLFLICVSGLILTIVVHAAITAFKPGIRQLPGPLLAKFTDLWRTYYAYRGMLFRKQQELHKRYGNYVRMGPNTVLVSESDVFQEVLGAKGEFPKVSLNDSIIYILLTNVHRRATFRSHGIKS
jgi:hypothetical protein